MVARFDENKLHEITLPWIFYQSRCHYIALHTTETWLLLFSSSYLIQLISVTAIVYNDGVFCII